MGIQETSEGLIVSVKVKPRSPSFSLSRSGGEIIIQVRSPPEEGKANQEIMRELPGLLRCEVRILRGGGSRSKLILLRGISEAELEGVLDSR